PFPKSADRANGPQPRRESYTAPLPRTPRWARAGAPATDPKCAFFAGNGYVNVGINTTWEPDPFLLAIWPPRRPPPARRTLPAAWKQGRFCCLQRLPSSPWLSAALASTPMTPRSGVLTGWVRWGEAWLAC